MTSAINGTVPANGGPLESEPIRDNFAAAKAEIEALQALVGYQTGQIVYEPNAPAETGWLECNGQAVSQATYAALFAAVGTWLPLERFVLPSNKDYSDTSANANCVDIDASGIYFAVARSTTPYLDIFKNTDGIFSRLSNPATLPTGMARWIKFSPSGNYLAVAHDTTPFITIYSRSGDTFTKLGNPATLPPAGANSVDWSANDDFLAVGHTSSPFITIYSRSGDTFTKVDNPATLPAGNVNAVAFSPNGNYLAAAGSTTPFINFYSRSGSTFTKLTNPATLPTNTALGVVWSNDSTTPLVMAQGTRSFLSYKIAGSTVTDDPAKRWAGYGSPSKMLSSLGGKYAIVGYPSTANCMLFEYAGGQWQQKTRGWQYLLSGVGSVEIDPKGRYIFTGFEGNPYSTIHDMTGMQTQTDFIIPNLKEIGKAWIKT